jgi:hypothetical protein
LDCGSRIAGCGYDALVVRDKADDPAAVVVQNTTMAGAAPLTVELRPAGGFVARLRTNH